VVASYRYDAWGNILEASGPLAQVNPYRYAGYRWDQSTGLYFLQARYDNPDVGRFISRDTISGTASASQTLNVYAYATGDPIGHVDPEGRAGVLALYAAAAVGGAVVGAVFGVVSYGLTKGSAPWNWREAGRVAARSALAGAALSVACSGPVAGAIAGAAYSPVDYLAFTPSAQRSAGGLAKSMVTGAVGGAIGGRILPSTPLGRGVNAAVSKVVRKLAGR